MCCHGCHATCHALWCVSCQRLTQPLLATNHNKIPWVQKYKVISSKRQRIHYWPRYGVHGPAELTLTLLLKYLAHCETINYVWYFQERVWPRSGCTYLEPATQLVEVSIFKKLLIWTYVRAVNTQLTTVHMKYDSNKLQLNHFYMCNIDIIANTMQRF